MAERKGQFIRAGVAIGLLGAVLTIQSNVLTLLPARYALPGRLLLLVVGGALGTWAIREGVGAVFRNWDRQAAVVWRNLSTWTLYLLLGLLVLSAVGVNLSGLLVGGAILGVILGTIAQPSLGNFFAGLVLMLARPYGVGTSLTLRGAIAGGAEMEGVVTDIAALYTTLTMSNGDVLKLPNSAVIASALTIRHSAVRAEVDVLLPFGTDLARVADSLRVELDPSGATVLVKPQSVDPGRGIGCRVEVSSPEPLDAVELIARLQALARERAEAA